VLIAAKIAQFRFKKSPLFGPLDNDQITDIGWQKIKHPESMKYQFYCLYFLPFTIMTFSGIMNS
jgi:hypothetical protein